MKRLTLATALLLCCSAASAQTYSKTLSTACIDRIAVTAFDLSNYNQLAAPRLPLVGDIVTAKLTFKHNCGSGSSISVPWQITVNGALIGSGNYVVSRQELRRA